MEGMRKKVIQSLIKIDYSRNLGARRAALDILAILCVLKAWSKTLPAADAPTCPP
jgi:hypothetical protein